MSAKIRLLAGAFSSCVATVVLAPAVAAAQAGAAPAVSAAPLDEVIVTGSRIPRPNLEQPAPVATLAAAAIENAATPFLGEALARLPGLSSSGTIRAHADSGQGLGGLSFADLRGLGTARTLTLVNGKRHVAGDAGSTAVDLNSIPIALVDRVEVVTGGASAIYGSDAVSGVVNIILKDRFEGFEVGVRGGGPADGGYGQAFSAYATGGWNFAAERGNVSLTLFSNRQERVRGKDIKGSADWGLVANPLSRGPSDGVPDRVFRPYVESEAYSANGNIFNARTLAPITALDAAGNPVPIPPRSGDASFLFGSHAVRCQVCYSPELTATPAPRITQYGAESTMRFDLAPQLTLRSDLKYVENHVLDTFSPSFTLGQVGLLPDNPFITPSLGAFLAQRPPALYLINRLNEDIGGRDRDTHRKTFRGVVSLEGRSDPGFADVDWELSYDLGRTRNAFHSTGGLITGNFLAAVDAVRDPATGQIRCRKDVPTRWYPGYRPPAAASLTNETCVPFDLVGQQNSQAAIDFVSFEADRKHTITQQVATATFRFDTGRFLTLPGGPAEVAGGVEHRREESRNLNDPLVKSGITESAPQPDARGGFEVNEAFVEIEAPLLRDQAFAHRLSFNGALRAADYSHSGEATAYKLGGVWSPWRDITLRGTYSRAVRAPNITEAFLPATSQFATIQDPCDASRINLRPNRAADCRALGITFQNALGTAFPGVASGNPDLRPETAKTWTIGVALQPSRVPGLSLTVDYYDIRIADAISFLDPQLAADKCVDGPAPAAVYCALISRNPASGQIAGYRSSYLNQAALKTAGYEIQLSYGREVAGWTAGRGVLSQLDGRLTGSIDANYLEKLRQYAFQDFPNEVDRQEGELGHPRWSVLSSLAYAQGPVTLTWTSRYASKVRRDKNIALEAFDQPYVEAVWYQDFVGRYRFAALGGTEVYAGVNNAFDKRIPLGVPVGVAQAGVGQGAMYEIFGRYLFAGLKARF